jgi:CRISPR-associated endonuclease Csn1
MCPLSLEDLNNWRHYKKGEGRKYPTNNNKFIEWLRFDFDGDGKPDFERLGFSKHESYYLFRALIVDENKKDIFMNEPHIIGRVLYQMVQRRGYNDSGDIDEKEKNELSKTILKGGGEAGAIGANEIEPYIEKYKTLGAALYYIQKENNVRIRKRYNLRSRVEAELKTICEVQNIPHLFKKIWTAIVWQRPLRSQKGLVGICTFEHNKSRCPISHPLYEEYRTWVFINNLKIRAIDDTKENLPILEILNNIVYPEFYKASADFKLSTIATKLKKVGFEIGSKFPEDTKLISFSFGYKMKNIFGEEWKNILGWNELLANKPKLVTYNLDDLWHLHFVKTTNKKTGITATDFLKQFAIDKLNLTEQHADEFAKIRLSQGYSSLSINAIKKLLPYLQKGFIYSEAVYLANLHKVLNTPILEPAIVNHFSEEINKIFKANKLEKKYLEVINGLINDQLNATHRFGMQENYQLDSDDVNDIDKKIIEVFGVESWYKLESQEKENLMQLVKQKYLNFLQKRVYAKNVFEKSERIHDKVFNWIKETYNIPDNRIKYLWHPSEQETYKEATEINGKKYLGSPEPISKGFKNPMALKTLHKLKQLINYLIDTNKIDEDTRIVIEIARELNDANKRKAIEKWQRDKEAENKKYTEQIIEINNECKTNFNPNDKNLIDKIRLWEEQKRMCLYTGKQINLCDILNGAKYDYEHSIPASMSFDNELKNLTIADKTYNQQIKGKKLPSECPNYDTEFKEYPPILDTIQLVFGKLIKEEIKTKSGIKTISKFQKIIDLEKTYQEWKDKNSDDKEIKNNIIIKRHYLKMELDYWRYKLNTFLITEYKAGWRNSQLRDTQTITKYALPYLKTIFKKVDVQKGSITADFRKIFKIQPRLDKKERTKHSHHAIDAAVLTLIPTASVRDIILSKYNQENENNLPYHELPRNWSSFQSNYILDIEQDLVINYLPEHRTLVPTEKIVRKRGRIQFVKQKLDDGKWRYKLDANGKKIPLVAKGDSIRGQLHKLSNFGAINNGEKIILVERYPIASFTSIADCRNIVDKTVRELVENALYERKQSGMSFDKAKQEPIPFHKGNEVIKKVRCKVAAGRGYLGTDKAIKIGKHNFESKHEYKRSVYVQNEENTYCLYYENTMDGITNRAFKIIGLYELAQLKIKDEKQLLKEPYYNTIIYGKGKKQLELPLVKILKVGTKCIFYSESIEELKDLTKPELLKRLFRIYKFNDIGVTKYIYLQNHLEASKNELLGNGDGQFEKTKYQSRLMLNPDKFICAIEGVHFEIKLDGEIKWF